MADKYEVDNKELWHMLVIVCIASIPALVLCLVLALVLAL